MLAEVGVVGSHLHLVLLQEDWEVEVVGQKWGKECRERMDLEVELVDLGAKHQYLLQVIMALKVEMELLLYDIRDNQFSRQRLIFS